MANTPGHYEAQNGVDPTSVVDDFGFWARNFFKYVWRAPFKNGTADVEKAQDCLVRMWELNPSWFLLKTRTELSGLEDNEDIKKIAHGALTTADGGAARARALVYFAKLCTGQVQSLERRVFNRYGELPDGKKAWAVMNRLREILTDYYQSELEKVGVML